MSARSTVRRPTSPRDGRAETSEPGASRSRDDPGRSGRVCGKRRISWPDDRSGRLSDSRTDRRSVSLDPLGDERNSKPRPGRSLERSISRRREYSRVTLGCDGTEERNRLEGRSLPPPRIRASAPRPAFPPMLGRETEGREIEGRPPIEGLALLSEPAEVGPLRSRGALGAGDERRGEEPPNEGADRLEPRLLRLIAPDERERDCAGARNVPPPPRNPPRFSPERPPPRFSPERPPPLWASTSTVVPKNKAAVATTDHTILLNFIAASMSERSCLTSARLNG